jgi:hypothetical protein
VTGADAAKTASVVRRIKNAMSKFFIVLMGIPSF